MGEKMSDKGKARRIFAAFVVLGLVGAACAGGGDSADTPVPGSGAQDSATETNREDGAQDNESAAPKHGGVLRFVMSGSITGMHPFITGATNDSVPLFAIYDTLTAPNLSTYEIEPAILESWSTSDDGLEWVLNVRRGVEFHDGSAMTAADVAYSINEARAESAPRTASLLTAIEEVVVVDEHTVTLKMSTRDSYLPKVFVDVRVIQDGGLDRDFTDAPIGTGPFKFVRWERNQGMDFVRNDNYWNGDLPYLDGVRVDFVPESAAQVARMVNDEGDLMSGASFAQITQLDAAGLVRHVPPGGQPIGFYDMRINTRREPWSDQRVRQALNYALDRDVIKTALGGNLKATANPVFTSLTEFFNEDAPTYDHDPERARQLLSEAGYGNGVDGGVMLVHPDLGVDYEIASELIQAQAAAVGINIELRQVDVATWVDLVFNQGDFDIGYSGTVPRTDEYDLIAHIWAKVHGQATGWEEQNPEFFERLRLVRAMTDSEEYATEIRELQRIGLEGSAVIVVGGRELPSYSQSRVQGFIPHVRGIMVLNEVWME